MPTGSRIAARTAILTRVERHATRWAGADPGGAAAPARDRARAAGHEGDRDPGEGLP